ncbi:MAG TPA: 6-pyruvoyl-tetrahydropterin synthase-related protein [Chloroflexota bacterium]|nr:6-pyruvoyl-tetrahydropterin synthase-related protein [Chloroflexota bacterium]
MSKQQEKAPQIPMPAPSVAANGRWWSLALVTLLAIPAIQPLLRGVLTCGFDNVFHLWRAVQIEALLRQGVLFSRWAPHMAQGYGYPLYQFQSPFSAYLAAGLHMAGLDWAVAMNGVYALAVVASGWTVWLLARDLWGDKEGILTAVAYLYAPYHAYVSLYRASLSETVAWAIVPLVLWGLRRWQVAKTRLGLVTAVISFVLLIFTHDVTAYAFLPFMLGWVIALSINERSRSSLGRGLLALTLGLGGSAFFWLPAIAERHFVQFDRATSAWPFLYFNNFLPLSQLLALPHQADPALLNDWPERGLGLLLALLAIVGTAVAWRRLPHQRWLTGFLFLTMAGYVWLAVAASRPLWDAIPLLQTFQFPWRFLAPATLAAALLAGGLLSVNRNPYSVFRKTPSYRLRITDYGLPLLFITLLSAAHWGWFYPQHCPPPADTSLAGMVAWETATATLGTTASRELLPTTVTQMPQDEADVPVWAARLSPADLPEGAQLLTAVYHPLRAEIEVDTTVPFTARFRAFFFPGWRAWVDGVQTPITPTADGLISFAVPDGRHTLVVAFGETPLRWLADAISLLSLAALVVILWRVPGAGHDKPVREYTSRRWWLALLLVGLALLAAKWLVIDPGYTHPRLSRLEEGGLVGLAAPGVTFGDPANPALVRLLGYEETPTAVPADQPLPVTLYWQALTPLDRDYRVGLVVVDEAGIRWSTDDLRDDRWARAAPPSPTWPTDQYARTALLVDLLPGAPPGTYNLQLSLFDRESLMPLTVYEQGQPIGPYLSLGTIEVQPPTQTAVPDTVLFADDAVTVYSAFLDRAEAAPGDTALLTLYWSLPQEADTAVSLSLVDESGTAWHTWPMILPAYGPGWWRSQLPLTLPVALADGRYTVQLTTPTGQTAVRAQPITIIGPERVFTPTAMDTAVNSTLGTTDQGQATLVGYTLAESCRQAGDQCQLTLLWLAEHEFSAGYRVFVHLRDAQGQIAAQADAIPGAWTRPTTGWLPGEYIQDTHILTLPVAGQYTLTTGMYDEQGHRLLTADQQDLIELKPVVVSP